MESQHIMVLVIVIISVLAGTVISVAQMIFGDGKGKKSKDMSGDYGDMDEAETMQAIYRGLTKLEDRIESLETIVIERDKRDKGGL